MDLNKLQHNYIGKGEGVKCMLVVGVGRWVKKSESISPVWLCDPMDCSLPGSSIHGIFQARVLEWVAIPFSASVYDYWKNHSSDYMNLCRQSDVFAFYKL